MKTASRILVLAAGAMAILASAPQIAFGDDTAGNPSARALILVDGVPVSSTHKMPVDASGSIDTSALATSAKQDTSAGKLDTLHTDLGTTIHGDLTPLATAAKQDTTAGKLDTLHSDLTTNGTNSTNSQASPGSDATKAIAVQGVTSGKAVNVNPDNVVDGVTINASVSSATSFNTFNSVGYGSAFFQFTSIGSGNTVVAECSGDGVTYLAVAIEAPGSPGTQPSTNIPPSLTGLYAFKTSGISCRLRVSAYGSGTVTAYLTEKRFPLIPLTLSAAVFGNVNSAQADGGAPVKTGGKYNSIPPTFSDGNRADTQVDANGNIRARILGNAASATDATSNTINFVTSAASAGDARPLGTVNYLQNSTPTLDVQRSIQGAGNNGLGVAAMSPAPNASSHAGISSTGPAGNATALNASSLIACTAACNVYKIEVVSLASAGYVMLFNAVSAPADGAVTPDACMPIAATSGLQWTPGTADIPQTEGTGATVVFSTGANCRTKTAAAADSIKVLAK